VVGLGAGAIAFSAGNWALTGGARCATGDGAGTLLAASMAGGRGRTTPAASCGRGNSGARLERKRPQTQCHSAVPAMANGA
jgi:hypothetical protein